MHPSFKYALFDALVFDHVIFLADHGRQRSARASGGMDRVAANCCGHQKEKSETNHQPTGDFDICKHLLWLSASGRLPCLECSRAAT